MELEVVIHSPFPLKVLFGVKSPIKWYLNVVVEVILTRGSGGLEPEKYLFVVVGGLLRLHLMIGLVVALVGVLS